MISNVHLKALLLGTILCLTPISGSAFTTDSGPVFFIGEDISHPLGVIVSVNEISSKAFHGGLGVSGEKSEIKINLTLVNNSNTDLEINVKDDFSLDIGSHHYKPLLDNIGRGLETIHLFGGAQSRLDVMFRVDSKEKEAPELIFKLGSSDIRIVCDENLGKIITENNISNFDADDVAKTAKLLIDAGRLTPAKNMCEAVLAHNPKDSRFLLLMAKIFSKIEEDETTAYYLEKIDVTLMNGPEEAEEAAKMAISIGYSNIALDILTAFDNAGLLNDKQKALKGKALYYEGKYKEAEFTLSRLFNKSYRDASAFFTMGNVYNRIHNYDEAIHFWKETLSEDPEFSEALFNLGVVYFNRGNVAVARDYWNQALRSNPDSATLSAIEEALKGTDY